MSKNAPAGWYPPDPAKPHELHYWDGRQWTDRKTVELAPVIARAVRGREKNPWWLSWPVIIIGFFFFVVPGVVLLWMRKGTHVVVKIAASVISMPIFMGVAVGAGAGDGFEDEGPAAQPSPSATAMRSPSPSPSTEPSATPAPSVSPTPSPSPSPIVETVARFEPDASGITVEEAVLALPVKGRAPKTGYDRDMFGSGWVDVDRNGCDTRNDMLKLRLTDKQMSGSCKVLAGTLDDPYTATDIKFIRGGDSEVDIDHIVALSDAWQKGATPWAFAKRVAFANDPLNLEPVDAGANRQKGDGDAATWLPSNKSYRCEYVGRQVAVKTKYGLWVTQAEQDAVLRVLEACPGYPLPGPGSQPVIASNTGGPAPTPVPEPEPEPAKTTEKPAPKPEPEPEPKLDPRFDTCKAAIAAGYGPYWQGKDPEYDWYRDGDGDGVNCER